jgi:hypothetical protein
MSLSDSAAKNGPQAKAPLTRAQRRKLKKTRAEARDFLREARRLARRYGKRIAPERLAQVNEAIAHLEAALPGEDVERLGAVLKKLDQCGEHRLRRRARGSTSLHQQALAIAGASPVRLEAVRSLARLTPTAHRRHIFVNNSLGVRCRCQRRALHWGGYRRGERRLRQRSTTTALRRRDNIMRSDGSRDLVEASWGAGARRHPGQDRGLYSRRRPAAAAGPTRIPVHTGRAHAWYPTAARPRGRDDLGPDPRPTVTHTCCATRAGRGLRGPPPPRATCYDGRQPRQTQDSPRRAGRWSAVRPRHGAGASSRAAWGKPGLGFGGDVGLRVGRFFDVVR